MKIFGKEITKAEFWTTIAGDLIGGDDEEERRWCGIWMHKNEMEATMMEDFVEGGDSVVGVIQCVGDIG